ncbi:hypothetical protein [Rhodosalinus sp. 5P4]|uniref:hypothetical protein n=1 Tax=Rhodosalinus sp. 5P4 TaxID=3239196 RepID=UPI003523B253
MTVVVGQERLAPDWRLLRTADGLVRILRDPPCARRAYDPFGPRGRCPAEDILMTLFGDFVVPLGPLSTEDEVVVGMWRALPCNDNRDPGTGATATPSRRPRLN